MDNSNITQVVSVTPDEFKDSIVKDVRDELSTFVKKYSPKQQEEYLSRKEVSQIFKVSLKTISEWCKNGVLKPYRLGKFIRFKGSEIDQALIVIENRRM